MRRLTVEHRTRYRYAEHVSFGPHRLMLRPRDSHGLRLLEAHLTLFPIADVNYVYDVFGNSIALVDFQETADELRIDSVLELEVYAVPPLAELISPEAGSYPFVYSSDDRLDTSLTSTRHYTDSGAVEAFARSFLSPSGSIPTLDLLLAINLAIKERFTYAARFEEGTQTPSETLALGSGTCRDFALLFMETVRELGFAARFVTGYLYTSQLDPLAEDEFRGAGATHAWAEVYLPGAGWIDFDPTNGIVGTDHLVRVAVVRDPRQAIPVNGSFHGSAGAFLGMEVEVFVSSHAAEEARPVISVPSDTLTPRSRHVREPVEEIAMVPDVMVQDVILDEIATDAPGFEQADTLADADTATDFVADLPPETAVAEAPSPETAPQEAMSTAPLPLLEELDTIAPEPLAEESEADSDPDADDRAPDAPLVAAR